MFAHVADGLEQVVQILVDDDGDVRAHAVAFHEQFGMSLYRPADPAGLGGARSRVARRIQETKTLELAHHDLGPVVPEADAFDSGRQHAEGPSADIRRLRSSSQLAHLPYLPTLPF